MVYANLLSPPLFKTPFETIGSVIPLINVSLAQLKVYVTFARRAEIVAKRVRTSYIYGLPRLDFAIELNIRHSWSI